MLIRLSYGLLGLQSFLTAGPKEVRAWTIRKRCSAVEAAKVIHSDIARGFVRAEMVSWSDYLACGGWKQAKEQNKVRLVLTTALQPDHPIADHVRRHGDGVHDIALWVDTPRRRTGKPPAAAERG